MSEDTTSSEAPESPAPTPNDVAEATQGRSGETPEQTIEGLRAALAKANAEAKENRIKARELDEVKAEQMSDLEKAQQAATAAQERLAEIEATSLRQKVAIEKGVPAKWVDRLRGSTEEELAADADQILADIQQSPTTPKPDLSQGSQGTPQPASTADKFAAAFEGRL